MEILNEIRQNLNRNENIPMDIKDKFFELIVTFNNKLPDINLDNLNKRIGSLKISRTGLYEKNGTFYYDVDKNEIFLSSRAIKDKDYDIDHLLMKGVIAIIASTEHYYGLNKDNQLLAINEGITEMIANFVIGNEGVSDREEELYAVNLISKIVGEDTLLDAYFNNDKDLFLSKMLEVEVG